MSNLCLHIPTENELDYRRHLISDEATMDYNTGYGDNGGCTYIQTSEQVQQWYQGWNTNTDSFYAYIVRSGDNTFLGEVNLHRSDSKPWYEMGIVLKANPDATVIISDLSPTVVSEWKCFLDKEVNSPNLHYAAFNFCDIPFSDNSIDVVSDGGGIGNTEDGEKGTALKEVYRVLKPGGMLVTSTGFVTKEMIEALPETAQTVLKEKRPDVFADLYEETVLAGFRKIDSEVCGGWDTDNDDSTIADLARSLGVNLHFTSYVRYCVK